MRKTEARMIQAIRRAMGDAVVAGRIIRCGNTEVEQNHYGIAGTVGYYREIEVRLHGSTIAVVEPGLNRIRLSDAGYRTATTKSRLNALLAAFVPGERIWQADRSWHYTEGDWPGSDEWSVRLLADNWVLQQAERLTG